MLRSQNRNGRYWSHLGKIEGVPAQGLGVSLIELATLLSDRLKEGRHRASEASVGYH